MASPPKESEEMRALRRRSHIAALILFLPFFHNLISRKNWGKFSLPSAYFVFARAAWKSLNLKSGSKSLLFHRFRRQILLCFINKYSFGKFVKQSPIKFKIKYKIDSWLEMYNYAYNKILREKNAIKFIDIFFIA